VDYDFTARLEDELDAVSRGEEDWKPLLRQFWKPFKERIEHTQVNVKRSDVTHEALDETCPLCGAQLSIRLGRHGRFVGCTNYPECTYTRDLAAENKQEPQAAPVVEGRACPKCGSALVIKDGRYGKFIGCSAYPKCNHIEPLERPLDTGVNCPKCGRATLVRRKSRRDKIFYSCSTYPACKYAVWNEPVNEPCPKCGWPILTLRSSKRRGSEKVCPQAECGYVEAQGEAEESVASG